MRRCASVYDKNNQHSQCLFDAKKDSKYCALHLSQSNPKDYVATGNCFVDLEENIRGVPDVVNTITHKMILKKPNDKSIDLKKDPIVHNSNENSFDEEKIDAVETTLQDFEDMMDVKLLILINDEKYETRLAELIGPAFDDITLSEDQCDPETFDSFWEIDNGIKKGSNINKYSIFSYVDLTGSVRCLTIDTLYNLYQKDTFVHPGTGEEMSEEVVSKAKELITLYQDKVNMFQSDINMSPEYALHNRIVSLFKTFHINTIYLKESWLESVKDTETLYNIIRETKRHVDSNMEGINSQANIKLFNYPIPRHKRNKQVNNPEEILTLKQFIVGEWEKMIKICNNPQNELPIWIITQGLSVATPEINEKYPDLQLMFNL